MIKQQKGKPAHGLTPLRFSEKHFPSLILATEKWKNAMNSILNSTDIEEYKLDSCDNITGFHLRKIQKKSKNVHLKLKHKNMS